MSESLIRIDKLVEKVFLSSFFSFLKNIRRLIAGMKDNLVLEQTDCEAFEQAATSVCHRMDALEQK